MIYNNVDYLSSQLILEKLKIIIIIIIIITNMLEMDKLWEIKLDNFKNAIDNVISNKTIIKNSIENMPNLKREEQLSVINKIFFNPLSFSLIKTINNIEWTPVKLYLTGYYIVNLYGNFWLVSHNSYKGFIVKSFIKYTDYVELLFDAVINCNIGYLAQTYWCSPQEIALASDFLEKNPDKYIILITQKTYSNNNPNSEVKISHYLYKKENQIYYLPFSNISVYKPMLYKTIF
jgi:hypothetical protein